MTPSPPPPTVRTVSRRTMIAQQQPPCPAVSRHSFPSPRTARRHKTESFNLSQPPPTCTHSRSYIPTMLRPPVSRPLGSPQTVSGSPLLCWCARCSVPRQQVCPANKCCPGTAGRPMPKQHLLPGHGAHPCPDNTTCVDAQLQRRVGKKHVGSNH